LSRGASGYVVAAAGTMARSDAHDAAMPEKMPPSFRCRAMFDARLRADDAH